jgi:outer membrane immunogenic protein
MTLKNMLAAAAALFMSTPVMAADLAPAPMEPVAPIVAPFTWSGFYIGIWGGGRTADTDWETTDAYEDDGSPIPFESDPSASDTTTSFRGAVYAGYNWQFAPTWVAGLEADVGYAKNDGEIDRIPGLDDTGDSFAETELSWDASIRGRVGFLVTPTMMLFGTGGVAFLNGEFGATCPADTNVCNPADGTQSFSEDETLVGWTVGGGVEAALVGNWLVRAEYRYSDFGSSDFEAIPATSGSSFGADAEVDVKTHTFGVGVAYKF